MIITTAAIPTESAYYRKVDNITSIPLAVSQWDDFIYIANSPIDHIPVNAFLSYTNLTRVILIGVRVQYIEEGAFNEQDELEKFTIQQSEAVLQLPSDFGPPTKSLVYMMFWHTLPGATVYPYFAAFEKLRHLDLGGQRAETLQAHLLPKNLTTIAAAYTVLPTFPSLGIYAPLLRKIIVHRCRMSAMPVQSVTGLTEVTGLHLHTNKLSVLPDLSLMIGLKILELHKNRLTSIPDLYTLPLTTLTLADNPLMCDKSLCWIRMWPWMKNSTIPNDEPSCADPAEMFEMKLMDVDPTQMKCFKG